MWFSDSSNPNTPRTPVSDRKFRTGPKTPAERKREEKLENIDSKFERATTDNRPEKPFVVEDDDRKSKITIVSLKSNRTSRTVQTVQSSLDNHPRQPSPAKGAFNKAKRKVQAGFRDASIKRIIASGLCIVTFLLLIFGEFLPFWNVYTYTVQGVSTGYYGGLWTYCETVSGDRTCYQYTESSNTAWFRAVRGFELMAFFGMLALLSLVIAYMFFLREIKYSFLQWIIVGLSFGTGLFIFIGLIVYVASYSDSSHISSAYGLTFCAFFGCLIIGGLFLWDKIEMDREQTKDLVFRGMSGARSSRSRMKSRMSHVRSTRSQARSHRSRGNASQLSAPSSIAISNVESNINSVAGESVTKSNTGRSAIDSIAGKSTAKSTTKSTRSRNKLKFNDKKVPPIPPIKEN